MAEQGLAGRHAGFADVHCNETVPKPYVLTPKGISFERKQNPRKRVTVWEEKG